MKLLISAAETSSDMHGGHLLQALKKNLSGEVSAFGMGGPHLQRAGLECHVDASELLAMGFSELIARLPKILRAERKLVDLAREKKPDLAIVIDYPDFHFRLARKLKKLGVPVVYFIPPKVWAWRKYRIRTLRKFFAQILSILPFEVDFYRRENLAVTYVGNPLLDELPLDLSRDSARAILKLNREEPVVLLMPGSRPAEVKRHLPMMIAATENLAQKMKSQGRISEAKPLTVLMPFPETQRDQRVLNDLKERHFAGLNLRVLTTQEGVSVSALAMKAADFGIVKSGTSALEAAMMGCAHFIIYRASWISEFIFNTFIRYPGPVGLPNLVYSGLSNCRPELVTELLAKKANVETLTRELELLAFNAAYRARLHSGFEVIQEKIKGDLASLSLTPSDRAARAIVDMYEKLSQARLEGKRA